MIACNQRLGASILLIVLVGSFLANTLWAEDQEKVIVISDKVGEVIDAQEREQYNILPAVKNFKSAVFLQLPDSGYVLEVRYEKDGEEKQMRISQTLDDLNTLRRFFGEEELKEVIPEAKQEVTIEPTRSVTSYEQGYADGYTVGSKTSRILLWGCISSGLGCAGAAGGGVLGAITIFGTNTDVSPGGGFLGSVVGGCIGSGMVMYFAAKRGDAPKVLPLGKKADYVKGYIEGYKEATKKMNVTGTVLGGLIGSGSMTLGLGVVWWMASWEF